MSDVVSRLSDHPTQFGSMFYESVDESPGLYSFWVRGVCLYVGKSMNLKRRLREHCEAEDNMLIRENFEVYGTEIKVVIAHYEGISEKYLYELESEAIRRMKPLANRQGMT